MNEKTIIIYGVKENPKNEISLFLMDTLSHLGKLTVAHKEDSKITNFADFDLIVLWGDVSCLQFLPNNKKVVFVPFLDNKISVTKETCWRTYSNIKVLSFSSGLYEYFQSQNLDVIYLKYYPEPRRNIDNIDSQLVDFTYKPNTLNNDPNDQSHEQIFLSAMAEGKALVVPSNSIMEEYIIHRHNGFIEQIQYDFENSLCALLESVQQNIYKSTIKGRFYLEVLRPTLGKWLFSEKKLDIASLYKHHLPSHNLLLSSKGEKKLTKVTVATVVRNAPQALERTINNISSQSYGNMEFIVIDGSSTDNTIDVIRAHDDVIDSWLSQPDAGPYDAMNKAAQIATGEWIIFINAGDEFLHENALFELFDDAPDNADFIIAHHVYKTVDGIFQIHSVNSFDHTWAILQEGKLSDNWLRGIPCHQSTATRTSLLRENKYNLTYDISADHEFMFRMKSKNASFHLVDTLVSLYEGGGTSSTNPVRCLEQWLQIGLTYSASPKKVEHFYIPKLILENLKKEGLKGLKKAFLISMTRPFIFLSTVYFQLSPNKILKYLGKSDKR